MTVSYHKVFISHASADKHRIEGLVLLLRGLGHEAFVASQSIPPGVDWESRLRSELETCDAVVVVWTRTASGSGWVHLECELASKNPRRPIIPINVDDTPLSQLLAARQAIRIPLVDTMLETIRRSRDQGSSRRQVDLEIRAILSKNGIDLKNADFAKIRLFTSGSMTGLGLVVWMTTVGFWLHSSVAAKVAMMVVVVGVSVGAGVVVMEDRVEPQSVDPKLRPKSAPVKAELELSPELPKAVDLPAVELEEELRPAELEEENPSRVCVDGIVLNLRARPSPGRRAWDLAPGQLARPDMTGYVEIDGVKERLRLREDKSKVRAPFFVGKRIKIDSMATIYIYDRDVNYHDVMASARVDLADLFEEKGAAVGFLQIGARCR